MQNKGTLSPGQSIVVNKFTVQVERYLSQGGFAHVYLVRTPTPVYNTTHHVLKRIAVASEGMLAEVKKEVDVMRLLQGHPNIVHLIDAAWHQMTNGMYEVFILMEYCPDPGGGIIDMMNRRLRERLTEAEILQIFVDVCEGVACMHNVRPPLLHRDLKVENILQSSPTSYKLCDFGSATTISRPPTTIQDIRVLESDLNRHTTLQYRAPEMIDVHSRRPIDEKSDVWALGVLLYKLCYYTTPFEEHGQLAILNVQYRIPPYPVYSSQMNQLIASMLQEHGVRRPSVFEILAHVHRLRGTKSRFKYTIPIPKPFSPREQTKFTPPLLPTGPQDLNVPQSNRVTMSVSPSGGQGIQARDKVMEVIAPLRQGDTKVPGTTSATPSLPLSSPQFVRRGRPPTKGSTRTESAPGSTLELSSNVNFPDGGFATRRDPWATSAALGDPASTDAWHIGGKKTQSGDTKESNSGFGDDFSAKFRDQVVADKLPPQTHLNLSTKLSLTPPTRYQQPLGINKRTLPEKDAFDGLGLLSVEKAEPTLAEARKLRTGLVIMHNNSFRTNPERPGVGIPRNTSSPRLPLSSQLYPPSTASFTPAVSKAPSPRLSPHTAPTKESHSQSDEKPTESRFPSLEELDSGFPSIPVLAQSLIGTSTRAAQEVPVSPTKRNGILSRPGEADLGLLNADSHPRGYRAREASRSTSATDVITKDLRGSNTLNLPSQTLVESPREESKTIIGMQSRNEDDNSSRSGLGPKHGNLVSLDVHYTPNTTNNAKDTNPSSEVQTMIPRSPARLKPKDWLTGEDDIGASSSSYLVPSVPDERPVLRDSPSKRASLILNSEIPAQSAAVAEHDHAERPPPSTIQISPTLSNFTRSFPPIDVFDEPAKESPVKASLAVQPTASMLQEDSSGSSGDDEPEDIVGVIQPARKVQIERKGHKERQSSVHDLVDLYGGGLPQKDQERGTPNARTLNSDLGPKHSSTAVPKPVRFHPSPVLAIPSALLPSHSMNTVASSWSSKNGQPMTPASSPLTSRSRSRPQSMFIFPSKSVESFSPSQSQLSSHSPELTPPEDVNRRSHIRRTSISDIVQRYEDISGATEPINLSSPPVARAVVKLPGLAKSDARPPKPPLRFEKENGTSTLPVPVGDRRPSTSPTEFNALSTVPITNCPIPIRRPPESDLISTTPAFGRPIAIRHHTVSKGSDVISPPTSLKSEAARPINFPAPSTIDDSLSHPESGTSSSPERPYQGVSKLIDQWQKKTAEAESSRTVVRGRGTFAPKQLKILPDS
ncbi:hypothetical protein C0993_002024 [Termitomyces sp. T159_Od127]|nr:hypothetical protein C0993_002024 [Termitomyces sp. T159_Od127]